MAKVCKVDSILFKNKTQSKIEQNGFLFERSELSTHIKERKYFKKNLLKKIGKKIGRFSQTSNHFLEKVRKV